jgi:hypothetical protein
VKLGKNASDTCAVLIKGHKNVEDNERSGHPRSHGTNAYVEKVCGMWCIQVDT